MAYYHVCSKWDGLSLESLYTQHGEDCYEIFATRWPDAGELAQFHCNVIHLYSTLPEAIEHQEVYGGEILVIDNSDEYLDIIIDTLEFPHPVAYDEIDAEYITRYKED